jgi:thioester reductase-like protein
MTQDKILLTGATGFIGGELLRRLARRDPRRLVCIVRAEDDLAAAERGQQVLLTQFGAERARTSRRLRAIEWVAGDVQSPRLGLSSTRFEALATEIQEIFHCAASTSFDQTLEDARSINVQGVKSIFALARAANERGGFRRLNHVSTAYVSGTAKGHVEADHLPADDPRNFRNTYERTKAEAERFLRSHMDEVPITVSRPSIVVGDSQTGRTTNWNVVYFPMRLMAWGRLPFASASGPAILDVVPVDYVAESVLALAARKDTVGKTYHVTAGDDALSVHDVIRETYAGVARRTGEPAQVKTRALGTLLWAIMAFVFRLFANQKVKKVMDGFGVYVAYTRVATRFRDVRERAVLQASGVRIPVTQEYFPVVVDYALEHNFGRQRSVRDEQRSGRLSTISFSERLALHASGMVHSGSLASAVGRV